MRGTDHREEDLGREHLEITPSTSGLPKSAMLSMKPSRKAFASPGRINGSEMVANTVNSARARFGGFLERRLTPCTTPISTRKAIGVKASICANEHAGNP